MEWRTSIGRDTHKNPTLYCELTQLFKQTRCATITEDRGGGLAGRGNRTQTGCSFFLLLLIIGQCTFFVDFFFSHYVFFLFVSLHIFNRQSCRLGCVGALHSGALFASDNQ